jgi:PAS domain S-box-containing protein
MNDAFYTFYQVAMIFSMVVSVGVLLLVIILRSRPGAPMMAVLTIGIFLWTLGYFLESHSSTLSRQLLFTDIGYVGMMTVPVAWFIFAAQYVGDYRLSDWRRVRWLIVLPVVIIVLIWTNGWHHLVWSNEHLEMTGVFTVTVKTYGPFFWVLLAYNYLLILGGIVVLVRRLFNGPPLYRNQAIALVIASLLPIVGNAFYMSGFGNVPHKDLTPVAFALSGLTIALGFWRFHLFQAVPFAREIVVRRLKDGIFIFSPEGRLLDANTAALEIIGSGQGIIGASLAELKLVSPLFETLSRGESRRIEVSLHVAAGRRTFELDTVPLRDNRNRLAGWLSMLHDITEQKEGERTLAAALDHERELRLSLEEEISRRLQFSQAMIHEVKSLVTDPPPEQPQEPPGGRTAPPRRDSGDLNMRLDELLDFTRGEMGLLEPAFRVMSPLQAISDVAAGAGTAVSSLRIELPETLPPVRIDEVRFKQIMRSLLDNAVARSEPGVPIELRARQDGDNVIIEVHDRGPDLTEEEQYSLFNPYERTALEPLPPGGLGLGLALSKMLAELHGGRIWVESRPGEGSTFAVSLPVVAEVS